jgi:hypothetical protein
MPVEQEGPAAVDVRRLEDGSAAQKRLVVRREDGLVRANEPAPSDGDGCDIHRATATADTAGTRYRPWLDETGLGSRHWLN